MSGTDDLPISDAVSPSNRRLKGAGWLKRCLWSCGSSGSWIIEMWHSRKRMFKLLNVNWAPLITSNRVTPRYLTEAVRFFQSHIVSRWFSRSLSLNEKERPVATPPPLVKRRSLSFFRSMSECQDETAPSSPAKSPTSRYKQGLLYLASRIDKQGAFSNHDDDGIKNVTNLHIWQWKKKNSSFARAYFIFWHFCRRSRSFYDVKWPVLETWANDEKCSILSSYLWSAGSSLIPV